MIKVETHCHSGGSWCATCDLDGLFSDYKRAGYGGVVITNHYSYAEYKRLGFETEREYAKYFLELIDKATLVGKNYGMKVFYGIEVRLNACGTEYVLYGFTKDFLLDNANIYEFTQEQLFKISNSFGILMYQSHPFREGVKVGNPKFMHGAEYFNGHYDHVNNNSLARKFCEDNNLIKMSGTDFHDKDQPITAGIYIPESINDSFELTEYVKSGQAKLIQEKELYIEKLIEHKLTRNRIINIKDLIE